MPYVGSSLRLLWFLYVQRMFDIFYNLSTQVYSKLERTIPGFREVMEKVHPNVAARDAKRKGKRNVQKSTLEEIALFGKVQK